jgi:uncharacterized protein (DUF4415 family)
MKKTAMKRKSASSRLARQPVARPKSTTRNFTRVVDADELQKNPVIRKRIDRELAALAKAGYENIDTSDAPELPAAQWKNAIRGMDAWLKTVRGNKLYKPVKQAVSMRLDADVVAWLKETGPGYQTRANQILREKMLNEGAS